MSKGRQDQPDSRSLQAALSGFDREKDRGAALIAAAWVDDSLDRYVRAFLRPEKKLVAAMLRFDGPLGSFASKMRLAYLVGAIEPTAYGDLEIIREIRNLFAHRRQPMRFTDRGISDRCKRLHAAQAVSLGAKPIRSRREMFLISAYFLSEYLLSLAREPQLGKMFDGDAYGAWIRRDSKSRMLQYLTHALGGGTA